MKVIYNWIVLFFLLLNLNKCNTIDESKRNDLESKLDSAMNKINEYQSQKSNDSLRNAAEWQKVKDSIKNNSSENSSLSTIYESVKNGVFFVYTSGELESKQGSAFLINEDGLCVSNYHVFEGTTSGVIKTSTGDVYRITKIIYEDEQKDYILFKVLIPNQSIRPLEIAGNQPRIGDECFAIGNPLGLSQTLSTGIISGFRNDDELIQTTAEITHGSSGGALFNKKGEVIGITTSGFGEADLNFAVNINRINFNYRANESPKSIPISNLNFIVVSERAYFHNEPREDTRRGAYLLQGNKAIGLKLENDFVYIDFTNLNDQNSKGWIRIKDISFQ